MLNQLHIDWDSVSRCHEWKKPKPNSIRSGLTDFLEQYFDIIVTSLIICFKIPCYHWNARLIMISNKTYIYSTVQIKNMMWWMATYKQILG